MEVLSQTEGVSNLPGNPGSLDGCIYSAAHNKVKKYCAPHKCHEIRRKYNGMAQGLLNLLETPAT
jgi:hypothetical protein